MFAVITGGSGSGKSDYAERFLAENSTDGNRYYLATMQPYGEEGERRIKRHQRLREGRGFFTVEQYTDIAKADLPDGADVLLECMSNLVANELFDGTGESGERKSRQIGDDIDRLRMRCRNLVVVTNEVSADGIFYDESTMEYIRCLNDVNIRMAEQAELVVEVAASLPVYWKKAQGEVLQVESCLMEKKENRMELIIGGYHQGKTDYIKKRYGLSEENMMDAEELTGCDMKGRSCLLHFHLLIRELLKKEVPVDEYLERLFAENEIRIITADEIGSGIVPVDAFERRYREETGRWVCRLAEKSERVIRVLYGIGQVMKGK